MKIRVKAPWKKCPNCFSNLVKAILDPATFVWFCPTCETPFEIDDSTGELKQRESKEIFGDM